jgi:hypothetical protein
MHVLAKDHLDALALDPCWRSVAAGLKMVVIAWIGLMLSFGLFIALACCVILWRDDHPWLAPLTKTTLSIYYVLCAGLCLAGMACCCRVPAHTRARRPAQAALALLVVGLIMFVFWQVYDPFRHWVPRGPYRYAVAQVMWLSDLVTVLTLTAAGLAWSLFLAAIAHHLEAADVSRHARRFVVAFAVWSGCVTTHLWLGYLHVPENVISLIMIVCIVQGGLALFLWMLFLLEMARVAVASAVRREV